MSIYDLDIKEIRKALRKFGTTTYGYTVFLIAYFVPFVAFLTALAMLIVGLLTNTSSLLSYCAISLLVFVVSFMIANAYYYRELREFVAEKHK